jgi:hypothetical protein
MRSAVKVAKQDPREEREEGVHPKKRARLVQTV